VTDRPIIFSAPMIRALLEGRKTQTRRILKPQPDPPPGFDGWTGFSCLCPAGHYEMRGHDEEKGPIIRHRPLRFWNGDRLWVRETWQTGMGAGGPQITFRATPDYFDIDAWDGLDEGIGPSFNYDKCPGATWHTNLGDLLSGAEGAWRSPIHMPRWASRLTLIVESVKVERLQAMNRGDAMEEGCPFPNMANRENPIDWFRALWTVIHGAGSWDANPWVCVISFVVQLRNIDDGR
jgi:hypothetical protein